MRVPQEAIGRSFLLILLDHNMRNSDINSAQEKFALYSNYYYDSIEVEIEDE